MESICGAWFSPNQTSEFLQNSEVFFIPTYFFFLFNDDVLPELFFFGADFLDLTAFAFLAGFAFFAAFTFFAGFTFADLAFPLSSFISPTNLPASHETLTETASSPAYTSTTTSPLVAAR